METIEEFKEEKKEFLLIVYKFDFNDKMNDELNDESEWKRFEFSFEILS